SLISPCSGGLCLLAFSSRVAMPPPLASKSRARPPCAARHCTGPPAGRSLTRPRSGHRLHVQGRPCPPSLEADRPRRFPCARGATIVHVYVGHPVSVERALPRAPARSVTRRAGAP